MEDSGTVAAWAALAAALLALVVALAQASQQYVATAQSMRKCEKSVWGPMPGHPGRRVWVWRQLRFRVVFDLPNLFIPSEYWPEQGNTRQFPASRVTSLPAPFDGPTRGIGQMADPEVAEVREFSEAGWVAFSRHVSYVCPSNVKVGLQRGDVDRLPADLAVVPMQVSLRDVIVLGLIMGMTITAQGEDYVEMSGPSGVIKSSNHPFLGTLLHFTAFSVAPKLSIKSLLTGEIGHSWILRLHNTATIAMQHYDESKRRYYEAMGMRWRTHRTQLPAFPHTDDSDSDDVEQLHVMFVDINGQSHQVPIQECETWESLLQALENRNIATAPYIIIGPYNKPIQPKSWKPLFRVLEKGDLKQVFKIKLGDYVSTDPLVAPKAPHITETSPDAPTGINQDTIDTEIQGTAEATRENASDVPTKLPLTLNIKEEKSSHSGPAADQNVPESTIDHIGSNGHSNGEPSLQAKSKKTRGALTWRDENNNPKSDVPPIKISSYVGSLESESESQRSGRRRREYRYRRSSSSDIEYSYHRFAPFDTPEYWEQMRDSAYVNRHTRYYNSAPPVLSFFWASQLDVELGPWATPWASGLFTACGDALGMLTEIALEGLRQTALRARGKNYDMTLLEQEVSYVSLSNSVLLQDLWVHLRQGRHTWPPYATNARTGFATTQVEHGNTKMTQFAAFGKEVSLPPLLLLQSVRSELLHDTGHPNAAATLTLPRDRLLELASIDSWLWQASERVPALLESSTEGSNVLTNAPALVEEVWLKFGGDIMNLRERQYDRGQGDASVREMAKQIQRHLSEFLRLPAECYIAWVALLRAAKVMECIKGGPGTVAIMGMLKSDQLVYLL